MTNVVCAFIKKDNKILIGKRLEGKFKDKWEFPGGKIEFGETDEEALEREIKEELNIIIKVKTLMIENYHDYEDVTVNLKLYYCDYLSGDIKLNNHSEIAWVNKKELLKFDLVDADRELAENL